MYSKDYYKRLQEWNASEKYCNELNFLSSLLQIKEPLKVLDYGCGIGTAMKHISEAHPQTQVFGFDINIFQGRVMPDYHFRSDFWFEFDRIYLMHSIAHFTSPIDTLKTIRRFLKHDGRMVIITPNTDWLWLKNGMKNVKSDSTVVEHFSPRTLKETVEKAGFQVTMSGQYGEMIGQQSERLYIVCKKVA